MKASRTLELLVACLALLPARSRGDEVPFYFYDFEPGAPGIKPGEPPGLNSGLQVLQGEAIITTADRNAAGQYLNLVAGRPFPAVYLTGKRLAQNGKTYLETWVRPVATEAAKGEEFLDFDGASLGFFRAAGSRLAEIQVYHATAEDSGCWVSTGWQVSVDETGRPAGWLRVGIVHDWMAETWQIEINGTTLLTGLRRHADVVRDRFELRLYGQELGDSSFDDVLISPLPPAELEARSLAQDVARRKAAQRHALDAAKRVSSAQTNQERRQRQTMKADEKVQAIPTVSAFHLKVIGGGKHITEIEYDDTKGEKRKTTLYVPGYDGDGKPLPLQVEIRCDAELKPGTTLDGLSWAITEQGDEKNPKPAAVLVHGTFITGPTQIAIVPSEWSNKGLRVHVGQLKLRKEAAAPSSD